MPSYKLTYFNGKGRGECARLLFAAAGVKFEDDRIEFANWPALKPKTPLGSLPVLYVDDKVVATSQAINRYLAREFNLYGQNNEENACVDMVFEVSLELFTDMIGVAFEKDEKVKEEKSKKLFGENAPKIFGYLEKKLGSNTFFVGSTMTLADIFFFVTMEMLFKGSDDCLDKFPKLKDLKERVAATDKIAAYLKARPQTDF